MFRWLKKSAASLLKIGQVRKLVAYVRYVYLAKLCRRLRTFQGSEHVSEHTIMHNLKSLGDLTVNRSLLLIRPLSVIESLGPNASVLTVGPRTEGEILNLVSYDFRLKNIRGLDLISYSPWIDLGDMHAMPYRDNSFDAVILGWVLSYSDNPRLAAREVVRVLRPGGVAAVGVEYNPKSQEEIGKEHGYIPGARRRLQSVREILDCFEPHVDHVYFDHEIAPQRRTQLGGLATIFSVKKEAPAQFVSPGGRS
jgi:SAM-dependent methyltransferase